jgi:dolichol-phosphate mannosyltransferase
MNKLGFSDTAQTKTAFGAKHDLQSDFAFALVIPMKDEVGNVIPLLDACTQAAAPLGRFEICVTDDGSTDGTADALLRYQKDHPELALTIITHPSSGGQSAAVHNAVRASRAPLICTLDGDGQNPPDQVARLLGPLLAAPQNARLALVAGQRTKRNDPLAKRWASRAANAIRGTMLRDGTRDSGCGLKAFRREAFLALPYFNHMHRFLPALFQRDGWQIALVEVDHLERGTGQSKYNNFGRAIVGISDLLGVAWLIHRRKPLALLGAQLTQTSGER